MALYKYKGYDKTGRVVDGVVEATDKKAALNSLRLKDVLPFELVEARKRRREFFRKRVDIGYLFFQIGVMLRCGLPLTKSLEIAASQPTNRAVSGVLAEIKDDITKGIRFSEALSRFPRVFPDVYVNMVKVAEATGGLSELLLSIADYEERRREQESQLKTALAYPLVVAVVGSAVVGFLLMYVMPKMIRIFKSVKIELPTITKILVYSGSFLRNYGLLITVVLGLTIAFLYRDYHRGGRLKDRIDRFLIGIELYRKAVISRFAELLSFQLREGIPLVVALRGCSATVSNGVFQNEIHRIVEDVQKGRAFSEVIRQSRLFDDMFKATVVTGESTGELSEFLLRVSHFMRKDVEKITKRVVSLAEPLLILMLGAVVGFIVLSIMLPIFELNQMVK